MGSRVQVGVVASCPMGTEFDVRIWFDEPGTPQERLASVLRTLDDHDVDWGPLTPVTAALPGRSDRQIRSEGDTPAAVASAVASDTGPGLLETGMAWPIWRFDRGNRGTPYRDGVHLVIEAWPQDWPHRPVPEVDGHVSVSAPSAPFAATGRGDQEAVARAEDNVEALAALLETLTTSLTPAKLAVFNGHGMHHTLNANALWLPTTQAWLDELSLLQTLWDEGCPEWKLGPLADASTAASAWSLHEGRTVEQRSAIWSRLAAALLNRSSIEPADVDAVLANGSDEVVGQGQSRLLLDLPGLFERYVGEVLVDLLEASAS